MNALYRPESQVPRTPLPSSARYTDIKRINCLDNNNNVWIEKNGEYIHTETTFDSKYSWSFRKSEYLPIFFAVRKLININLHREIVAKHPIHQNPSAAFLKKKNYKAAKNKKQAYFRQGKYEISRKIPKIKKTSQINQKILCVTSDTGRSTTSTSWGFSMIPRWHVRHDGAEVKSILQRKPKEKISISSDINMKKFNHLCGRWNYRLYWIWKSAEIIGQLCG